MATTEQFAREHHVHYDVQPEHVGAGADRAVVGFDVRIFATHEGPRLAAPGCEKCVELADALASFAGEVVGQTEVAGRAEVVPAAPVLYQSTEVKDADEVALTVRVRCDAPEHHAGEDPCLRAIRERLDAAGAHMG